MAMAKPFYFWQTVFKEAKRQPFIFLTFNIFFLRYRLTREKLVRLPTFNLCRGQITEFQTQPFPCSTSCNGSGRNNPKCDLNTFRRKSWPSIPGRQSLCIVRLESAGPEPLRPSTSRSGNLKMSEKLTSAQPSRPFDLREPSQSKCLIR